MKPVSAPPAPTRLRVDRLESWRQRSGRLYAEFERAARAMVRRGFHGAFGDDELDDIYSNAWLGTLRTLESRHQELSDEEIRSYVFTAVAHQASREIRRRKRKPTAPLELVASTPDTASPPDEHAIQGEESRVTRDLLGSLPPRRRAVMLLRYGWGLEPKQVCGLVKDLSPRAYRKEITRGVDELTEKMRKLESGEWCADREPVLKKYASGLADSETARQAQAHLSHCRDCSDFVARLNGHLHDLGSALAAPAAVEGIDGHLSVVDRLGELGDRAREGVGNLFSRASSAPSDEGVGAVVSAGGARGAGAAGAGVLAKLGGLGTATKVAVACIGGGAAATACVAAGVGPLALPGLPGASADRLEKVRVVERPKRVRRIELPTPAPLPPPAPSDGGENAPAPASPGDGIDPAPAPDPQPTAPEPAPEPVTPFAESAPPVQQEFGVAAAAAPTSTASSSSASSDAGSGGPTAAEQEFGGP